MSHSSFAIELVR